MLFLNVMTLKTRIIIIVILPTERPEIILSSAVQQKIKLPSLDQPFLFIIQ